jgi:ABC-type dipeptide/oligopeptide/nickel transport system permease component/ABC-type antimicrobial peptide transport system permease subunit
VNRLYRLLAVLGLLVASSFAVFALLEAAPRGPAAAYPNDPQFGAERPFYAQYAGWMIRVLHGDLGWSTSTAGPVSDALAERLPATIELALVAFTAALVLGAIAGFARARARARIPRELLTVLQLVCRALPIVILAQWLQYVLAITGPLPASGVSSADSFDLRDRLAHLVLPVLSLAVPFGAWSSVIFYDFFRSNGASLAAMRRIAGPVAMTAASIGPALLAATLIIEPVFGWPGAARLFFSSLSRFDVGYMAGFLLMYVAWIVLIVLCAEFAQGTTDRAPALRTASAPASARRRKRFSPIGVIASAVLLVAVLCAAGANALAPIGPYFIDQVHWEGAPLAPGAGGHLLGTDENGRDLLARALFGLRTSLGIAVLAAVIATPIAAAFAKAAPWFGERGAPGVTGIRPFAAVPMLLALVTVLVTGHHTAYVVTPLVITLIVAAVSWPAAVPALSAIAPATLGRAMIDLTAGALLLEVTLSLFGFGIQPPTPSLGNMLVNAQSIAAVAPWAVLVPTAVVILVLSALYAVAERLPEANRSSSG